LILYNTKYDLGHCNKIRESLDFEIDAGWCGGFVDKIEPDNDFCCIHWIAKKENDN